MKAFEAIAPATNLKPITNSIFRYRYNIVDSLCFNSIHAINFNKINEVIEWNDMEWNQPRYIRSN